MYSIHESLIVERILKGRQSTSDPHGCAERTFLTWVHCNIIWLGSSAWVGSLCLVVFHCSAAECNLPCCQQPAADLLCLLTSTQAGWRQWIYATRDHSRLLHTPTHAQTDGTVKNNYLSHCYSMGQITKSLVSFCLSICTPTVTIVIQFWRNLSQMTLLFIIVSKGWLHKIRRGWFRRWYKPTRQV